MAALGRGNEDRTRGYILNLGYLQLKRTPIAVPWAIGKWKVADIKCVDVAQLLKEGCCGGVDSRAWVDRPSTILRIPLKTAVKCTELHEIIGAFAITLGMT